MVIVPTLWMLIGVVGRALPVFHWSVLVEDSHGGGGGLRNAIVGTLVLGLGVVAKLVVAHGEEEEVGDIGGGPLAARQAFFQGRYGLFEFAVAIQGNAKGVLRICSSAR